LWVPALLLDPQLEEWLRLRHERDQDRRVAEQLGWPQAPHDATA
jgi:hypothetical protein